MRKRFEYFSPNMVLLKRVQSSGKVNYFTACKRSYGKVMFSLACVKNSVHKVEGVYPSIPFGPSHPPGRHPLGRHLPRQTPPGQTPTRQTPPEHYEIRWYASYRNALLFQNNLFPDSKQIDHTLRACLM